MHLGNNVRNFVLRHFWSKCETIISRDEDVDISCVWQKMIRRAQHRGSIENVEEWKAHCKAVEINTSGPLIYLYGCIYY